MQIPPGAEADEAVVLKEGFCWWAVLFGPLWFLWQRQWIGGVALLLVQIGLGGLMDSIGTGPLAAAVPAIGVALLVGFCARDWCRWRLESAGYRFADVVVANDQGEAEWRWLARRQPTLRMAAA